jgi:flagellar hook-associated protein 2
MSNLSEISKFKNALQKKAKDVMINPMEYISKSIISYKHPTRPSGDTYSTSIYTGMLYNGYC